VKHYLITPEDISSLAAKSVPDFLMQHKQFRYLLQFTGEYHSEIGVPLFVPVDKDVALSPYYSAKTKQKNANTIPPGYSPLSPLDIVEEEEAGRMVM